MELGQKVGSGIVMGVPTLVGSIYLGDVLGSWLAIFVWIALMVGVYVAMITGRFSRRREE